MRGLPSGARAAYSRSRSTLRRAVERSSASAASLAGSSSRSAGSTITSAPASSPSSFSSGFVNAACAGPRRPSITISRQPGADDRVDRGVGRVGRRELLVRSARASGRRRPRRSRSRPRPRARRRGRTSMLLEVGMAVVPGDEHGRGPRAGQVLAGDAEPPVGLRADRVDDGVVERARARRGLTSRPTSTLPKKRKPGSFAIFSNTRETALIFGWSGATPRRTRPHGRRQPLDQVDLAPRARAAAPAA